MGGGVLLENCDSTLAFVGNSVIGNQTSEYGGGIFCDGSSVHIVGCTIDDNTAEWGGGIGSRDCSPTIRDNTLRGNHAGYSGGAISCRFSPNPVITGNLIEDNFAQNAGGGVNYYTANPTISGNTIRLNWAENGGGIRAYAHSDGTSIIDSNLIVQNTGTFVGGGIHAKNTHVTISRNEISDNYAPGQGQGGGIFTDGHQGATIQENLIMKNRAVIGGGICCSNSRATLSGNIIVGNLAWNDGAGVAIENGSDPTIEDNSICENEAWGRGGGLFCTGTSVPQVTENTIARNQADGDGGGLVCGVDGDMVFYLNTLTENISHEDGDGIYTEQASPVFSSSNVAYNGVGAYNDSPGEIPSMQNNWWGHSTGPWHEGLNPEGMGDSLSTYAWDFVPWLTEADTVAPPIPPIGLAAEERGGGQDSCSIALSWLAVPLSDLDGYRVHFDTDTTGFPYQETADVGNVTSYIIEGINCGITHYIAVTCYDRSGNESWYSSEIATEAEPSSVVSELPGDNARLCLEPGFPNPFRSKASILYTLRAPGWARLTIHDASGRRIATLADGFGNVGLHRRAWMGQNAKGTRVAPGVYFVRLESQGSTLTRKIVVVE